MRWTPYSGEVEEPSTQVYLFLSPLCCLGVICEYQLKYVIVSSYYCKEGIYHEEFITQIKFV